MQRKCPFHALTGDNPSDREVLTDSVTPFGNHNTRKLLDPLLFPLQNPRVHVDGIADREIQLVFPQAGLLGQLNELVHGIFSQSKEPKYTVSRENARDSGT